MLHAFRGSLFFTVVCMCLGVGYGIYTADISKGISVAVSLAVLAILEISLSFDNAVVNATVLRGMTSWWRGVFLTWGILIAVFGMRVVFPLLIVGITAKLGPVEAFQLAFSEPTRYQSILESAHVNIMGFGGAFLFLVGLKFFFDSDKDIHWVGWLETLLKRFADLEAAEIIMVLGAASAVAVNLPSSEQGLWFMISALAGISTYFAVSWIGDALGGEGDGEGATAVVRSGLGAFLYLELVDASFSFDGVIGAFAVSSDLIVIALGLGIGAMFVRSLTIFLVDSGTLQKFVYLEHGAFWAILTLAVLMYASTLTHVPELVTGGVGASLIIIAAIWSRVFPRAEADEEEG